MYWEAVDHTVRYFDSVILKKKFSMDGRKTQKQKVTGQKDRFDQKDCTSDRFQWQNPMYDKDQDTPKKFCTLPTPPPMQNC